MSDASTVKMISKHVSRRAPSLFLTSLFRTPAENFHTSEAVEFDIQRFGEDVAIPVIDGNGHRVTTLDKGTNKKLVPPTFKESIPISAGDLLRRYPGDNPFADINFMSKAARKAMDGMMVLEDKLRRVIELQGAQVLQDGTVSLVNEDSEVVYTLDYGMKATHKITAGTDWDTATGAQMLDDLIAACGVNRDDGLVDSNFAIMGEDAWKKLIGSTEILALLNVLNLHQGSLGPMRVNGNGGQFRGTLEVGMYKLDIWTYNGHYKHPATGVQTPFITPQNVIVMHRESRRDLTYGAVPMFPTANRVLAGVIPRRIAGRGVDIFANAWTDNSGETLTAGVSSRPLCIPTAIDTYSRIATGAGV